jgi:prepilin-type N-terminal cleavage/methylation domain-containing protein
MRTISSKKRASEKGFTLVELAIVMIIIGLLITGVLKGQEMVTNAQVTSTVAQVKGIDAAVSTFRDTFKFIPGDLPNAGARLANCGGTCAAAAPATTGNGVLGVDPSAAPAGESLAAFSQLAAANLISGANPTPVTAAINLGDEIPEAALRNVSIRIGSLAGNALPGAAAAAATSGAAATWRTGTYLALGGAPGVALTGAVGTSGVSPIQAQSFDTKMDDGVPTTGQVRGGGNAACAVAGPPVSYGNGETADCSLFVRIQG